MRGRHYRLRSDKETGAEANRARLIFDLEVADTAPWKGGGILYDHAAVDAEDLLRPPLWGVGSLW